MLRRGTYRDMIEFKLRAKNSDRGQLFRVGSSILFVLLDDQIFFRSYVFEISDRVAFSFAISWRTCIWHGIYLFYIIKKQKGNVSYTIFMSFLQFIISKNQSKYENDFTFLSANILIEYQLGEPTCCPNNEEVEN